MVRVLRRPWEQPRPKAATDYDVVVIGSVVGGYTATNRAGQLGLKTVCAVVLGGTRLIEYF